MTDFRFIPTGEAVDLTNCDREPIHIPGRIQPQGALLVVRDADLVVVRVSENVEAFLGIPVDALLGSSLTAIADPAALALLRAAPGTAKRQLRVPLPLALNGRAFDAQLHRQRDQFLLDLEPASEPDGRLLTEAAIAVERLERTDSLEALSEVAAEEVRRLTGYDRVMVYRFDADGHGHVFAEARRADLEPFLGLHYPASDIPKQARALYLENWLRIIADVGYEPVPVRPTLDPATGAPLDMGQSGLRAVSPIHIEYLTNMGVCATLTISLVRDGALWGLFACHHYAGPKGLPAGQRAACELIGRVMSAQLSQKEDRLDAAARERVQQEQAILVEAAAVADGDPLGLPGEALLTLAGAGGCVVVVGEGGYHTYGDVPPQMALDPLVDWLRDHGGDEVFATDALARVYPAAAAFADVASGLAAIAVSRTRGVGLLWFRPEVVKSVHWAGDPNKAYSEGPHGARLSPRGSFDLWKETVRGTSEPWRPWELEAMATLRRALTDAAARRIERQELAQLRRLDQLKDNFLSTVSHDLRTPLNFIMSFASVLEDGLAGPLTADQERYVGKILAGSDQLLALVDNLLDFARLEAGEVRIEPKPLALAPHLRGNVESFALIAGERSVALETRLGAVTALADEARLNQIMGNLLANALKFTPAGGRVTVVAEPGAPGFARVAVEDTGRGIAAADRPRIFERFFQAAEVATGTGGQTKGSGLGLAIVERLVTAMGGQVGAESEPGRGTTIWFTLPLAP